MILGLDVSTKTIGIALFDNDGELKILTHVTPKLKPKPESKFEELYQKAQIFQEEFLNNYRAIDIDRVIIEEPLLRSNNVNTVSTLLRFNTLVASAVREKLDVIPEFISSYDARKYGFPELMGVRTHNKKGEPYPQKKIDKADPVLFGAYPWEVDKKMVVWEKVADLEPQITWPRMKTQKLKNECFDTTDAYCCVRAIMKRDGIW
jgi:RNase H-fold protein (predicted Holliday junction resolvase)